MNPSDYVSNESRSDYTTKYIQPVEAYSINQSLANSSYYKSKAEVLKLKEQDKLSRRELRKKRRLDAGDPSTDSCKLLF